MHQECELSIITINYNGLKDTCAMIETIPFNDKMEVIVVDNASTHDEASEIQKKLLRSTNIQICSSRIIKDSINFSQFI